VRVRTGIARPFRDTPELGHTRKFVAAGRDGEATMSSLSKFFATTTPASVSDVLDDVVVLDDPLAFVWPLAGPFGAVLLSAMAWLSI
jgi:hypothetical protein